MKLPEVTMSLKRYFLYIKLKINKFDKFINNSKKYENIFNPFLSSIPKTYVWIDETDK